jgi:hypothetical protein
MLCEVLIEGIVKDHPSIIEKSVSVFNLKSKNDLIVSILCKDRLCNYVLKTLNVNKEVRVFGELVSYNNQLAIDAKHIEEDRFFKI